MGEKKEYFFCGIGGSGMLPLAMILAAAGHRVAGSDRALDQGRTREKFDFLSARGVTLHPQNGSGITHAGQVLVASAAVEDTVPDIAAARRIGARRMTRAELLADLFNAAPGSVGVAGTSGKSTTTAMLGWILAHTGNEPTIVNGAVMKNFITAADPFASAHAGAGGPFVSEVDESDGSIALFAPTVAVVNNIALDHKSLEELRALFGEFVAKADMAVLNLDNAETAALAAGPAQARAITYSLTDDTTDLTARDIAPAPGGVSFVAHSTKANVSAPVRLAMPGRHNVSNALAALCAADCCGIGLKQAAEALSAFAGVKRRLERVGEAAGVTVIDDFAHNPDKIAASLATLREFPGRLVVMFQPHGFGPLKLMKDELIAALAKGLAPGDVLIMPEPVYFGGTVERVVSSKDIAAGVRAGGRSAEAFDDRAACGERLLELAETGDRIVIMGARDDTLSEFAGELLAALDARGVSA